MRRIPLFIALIIILVGSTGGVFPLIAVGATGRVISIVAQNMAFVTESMDLSEQANPTITVKPGQKITIVFRNDDPGMLHDFVIQGLPVQTEAITYGKTTRITFTAPQERGTYIYLCSFHPRSMRGVFIVE